MRNKCIHSTHPVTYAVVFDKGEEVIEGLTRFAVENVISNSQITATGAFSQVVFGYFDRDKRDYKKFDLEEQVELLCLTGEIAIERGSPKICAYAIVGMPDGTTRGGHVIKASVWPTLEVIVTESPEYIIRRYDPETGMLLIDLGS